MEDWCDDTQQNVEHFSSIPVIEGNVEDLEMIKALSNETSYIGKKLTTDKRVPGRINDPIFLEFWEKELKAPKFILDTLALI